MKTALILLSFLLTNSLVGQVAWLQKNDFVSKRAGGIAFSIAGYGYSGLGVSYPADSNDLWRYDPLQNTWTKRASFPGYGRASNASFVISSKAYVGLGDSNTSSGHNQRDFWEYDSDLDRWTKKANFPSAPRAGCVTFGINGKGYIGLGNIDTTAVISDFWEYNPDTDVWTRKADFPGLTRIQPASFAVHGKGYFTCGTDAATVAGFKKDVWEYDPVNDTWTQKADFPGVDRLAPTGFTIGDDAYIVGGVHGSRYQSDVWRYDAQLDTWTEEDSIPTSGRMQPIAFSIAGRGYVGLGAKLDGGVSFSDFWEYAPDSIHTGLADLTVSSLAISPNPTSDKLYLNTNISDATISITDLTGRSYEMPHTGREIDVSALATGVYILRLQDRVGSVVRRFVRE